MKTYYVYITTNSTRRVLYTGMTNNLKRRMSEHYHDSREDKIHFTGKYNCYHLIYYEKFVNVMACINREKEIKGWSRAKKENLIRTQNPNWDFLNDEI